jgi:hypothetical protein
MSVSCKDGTVLARCLSAVSSQSQSYWSTGSLSIHQNRNFTTDARNKDEAQANNNNGPPSPAPAKNLETIAKSAQEIVDEQLLNEETQHKIKENNRVIKAAQGMLALTSSPHRFAADLWTDGDDKMTPAGAQLHRCLVHVTSACIKAVSPESPKLLECAMDLAKRAYDLSLPLHLPLYRNLCTAIATHSRDSPAASILEVSVWATSALCIPLDSSFFEDSLVALVRAKQFEEAADLRWSIQSRHDIDEISTEATLKMFSEIKAVLKSKEDGQEKNIEERESVMNLILTLYPKLLDNLDDNDDAIRKRASTLASTIESLLEDDVDLEDLESFSPSSDEDLSDIDSDDETAEDEATDLLDALSSLVDTPRNNEDVAALFKVSSTSSNKEHRRSKPSPSHQMVVTVQIDKETGELHSISPSLLPPLEESNDGSSQQDEEDMISNRIARNFIYMRNSTDWEIPDVTHQLVSMNGGEKILYSRSYEEKLMQDLMANEHEDLLDD